MNANGTYDILYDDGDTERGVRQSLIRRRERSSSPRRENAARRSKHSDDDNDDDDFDGYRRGDNIEARYKGKSKWYKGSISRVNANNTYDILYDDGDTERGVRQSLIRRRGRSSSPRRENAARRSKHSDDDNDDDDFDGFRRGDNIEARYKGKSKWYKGSISRVNANGTYDILYDDGDTERGVRQSLIRRRERSSSPRRANAARRSKHSDDDNDDDDFDGYRRGDNIEARYKGKSKWYKGSISRVNANNTYDILYDDGDTERGVRESLIRRRGRSSSPRRENAARRSRHSDDDNDDEDFDGFRRGDNIEARYKGKSKWYKGSISRVNANGTYDILYDDGDTERGVRQSLIRRRGRSSSPMRENAARRNKHSDDDNDDDDFDGYFEGAITSKLDTKVNQSGTRGPFRE